MKRLKTSSAPVLVGMVTWLLGSPNQMAVASCGVMPQNVMSL